MKTSFASLTDILDHGFDTVIDVRSPAEFAEDHVPGAINLPALSNEERARVGTIYVQEAPFKARKIGAALVARNVAEHLDGPLKDIAGNWQPLIYCWRGGQRSGSFASILSQIGWRAKVIEGGYQSYRNLVHDVLYKDAVPHKLILLDGNTGTAKTDILHRLHGLGVQVLDLEGLANHRGSLLGSMAGGQPAQKGFETALARALARLDPTRPVIVEAESSKVGERVVPPTLWAAMKAASRIETDAPLDARAQYLADAYVDISADATGLTAKLEILRRNRGGLVDGWLALLRAGEFEALARVLMDEHYDPTYRSGRTRHGADVLQRFDVTDLGIDARADLAMRIAAWVEQLS
ncbi:tRNA 2-selenouridine synthase SelU [Octadecabacter antarcticus 307]|uniref:tRNA 2-selenouridine synthase SelU n=1 Tax=Octadecabacter antarcticus 307 TaxID=391626 RepID=M9RBZ9_9RHOB|nr:tRNA 2-selenouridine(34) synthase MnmH [Octadecabacter antarcticus]AGI70129.1 tRNA 2-selenouridine synthase SelU [Octadecabacter antarcticus 307]